MATLRAPDVDPHPSDDCKRLRRVFKGRGRYKKVILRALASMGLSSPGQRKEIRKLLGHRNANQRRKIRETYQLIYNESLIDQLHSKLSGDFKKAVVLWTYDPPERDARLVNEALKSSKKGITQLQVIIEIACATSPHHLMAVRQAYCSIFDCSLEEDITSNVPQPVAKVLVSLVSSYRYDKEDVDMNTANSEAAKLHDAIEGKHLDHDDVVWILSTRNVFQLRATFECYQQKYGNSIYQDIKSCGNGILESVLTVVILCIDSPEKHFAEVIRASIVGLGTDEDVLTRAIVTRAEVDMMKISREYFEMNKTKLTKAVAGDTSGDYRKFLLTLLGDEHAWKKKNLSLCTC